MTRPNTLVLILGRDSLRKKPRLSVGCVHILSPSLLRVMTQISRKAERQKARHTIHGEPRPKKTVTYNAEKPDTESYSREPLLKKRKVSMGIAVDAETGTVIDHATRKSSRSATVMNKQDLHERIKLDEEKKVLPSTSLCTF